MKYLYCEYFQNFLQYFELINYIFKISYLILNYIMKIHVEYFLM